MKANIKNLKHLFLVAALSVGGYAAADDAAGMGALPPPPFAAGPHGAPGQACGAEGHGPERGHEGRPGGRGMAGPGPDHEGPGGPGMPPPLMAPFLHGIELTDAQQDKVFAILHAEMPYLREQHKAAMKAHEALRALSGSAQFDDAKAAALAQAGAQAMANIELQRARTEQKLLALLTPEQRKQLAERPAHRPSHS